jgi:hypothetical protein
VVFFSFFWIGSYEQKIELYNQLPFSFLFRFVGLSTIGLIGVGVLILFNLLIEKLVSKEIEFNSLKKLAIQGFTVTVIVALIGTILFFL